MDEWTEHYRLWDFEPKKKSALLYIHGGAWVRGDPQNIHAKRLESIASFGLQLASGKYRLATETTPSYPGVKWDIQQIVNTLRWNGYEDITIIGTSAGANLALISTLHYHNSHKNGYPHPPADRMVLCWGVYDYVSVFDDVDPDLHYALDWFLGVSRTQDPVWMEDNNPVALCVPDMPSVLMIDGLIDETVNHHQTVVLESRLNDLGVYNRAIYKPEMGHAGNIEGFLPDIASFVLETR